VENRSERSPRTPLLFASAGLGLCAFAIVVGTRGATAIAGAAGVVVAALSLFTLVRKFMAGPDDGEIQEGTSEARLLLTDKMAALGTLSAGIAHEINNPLSYVLMNQEQLLEALAALNREGPDGGLDEAMKLAREALHGVERTRAIVRALKTFSRHDEAETRIVCDLHAVLDDSIRLAWSEIRYKAAFGRSFGKCPPVCADPARLSQVFLNLLVNAAQAIPADEADRNRIIVTAGADDEGNAVISVADTGHGIRPENVARIFDPFFTTKAVGSGTGLGLAICHNIVSALNGELSVESGVGKGSTFTVKLPSVAAGATSPGPAVMQSENSPPAPSSSILVVDDEEPLLAAIERTLLRSHRVVGVSNGNEALELIRDGGASRFDLILCDISMAGISGIQLFERLRRISPRLSSRFAFITGGALSVEAKEFLEKGGVPVLEKPFSPSSLQSLVSRILNTATSEGNHDDFGIQGSKTGVHP
jgi:signal transduction histidine kinase/CheY-like chemotaxis protein